MYHFDNWGWYTEQVLDGRATPEEPVNQTQTTINGELRSNFTGYVWIELPYVSPPTPENSEDAIIQEITIKTQKRLDDWAFSRGYDNIISATTYVTSTVPRFASDARDAVNARDATWSTLLQYMEDVKIGEKPIPTSFSDVEVVLPSLVWSI